MIGIYAFLAVIGAWFVARVIWPPRPDDSDGRDDYWSKRDPQDAARHYEE